MSDSKQGGTPPDNLDAAKKPDGRVETRKASTAKPLVATPPTKARPKPPPPIAVKGSNARLVSNAQRSRYQQDVQRQRWLLFGTIGVIALIVVVLIVGIFSAVVAPNIQTLAEVRGQSISAGEYQRFRKLAIFKELGRLSSLAGSLGGDTQQQINQRIQLLQFELTNIGSQPVDQATLESLVKIKLIEDEAKKQYNITVSDDEVNNYAKSQDPSFALYTPTPNATNAPVTATAGAIETAAAAIATATASNITPLPTSSPVPTTSPSAPTITAGITATANANATATAQTTPGVTPSPSPSGSPQPTATTTPLPTNTALPSDRAQSTVDTRRSTFLDSFKKVTGLSEDDYKRYEIRPLLIKRKVSDVLLSQLPALGAPYPQLEASRVVTATESGALELLVQLKKVTPAELPKKFADLAREQTSNTVEQPKNGYMGWFIDGTFAVGTDEDLVWKAANKLQIGELSDPPARTSDGFEIILLSGRDDKRPLDANQIKTLRTTDQNGDFAVFVKWLDKIVKAEKPKYYTSPTPTVQATAVAPPVFTPAIPPTATPNVTASAIAVATAAALATPAITGTPAGPVAATTAPSGTIAATTVSVTTAATTTTGAATTAPALTPSVATTPSVVATTVTAVSPTPTR